MFEQFHEICAIQIALVFFVIIECAHDGHVGGPKQYTDFPLGNIFYFYANIFYCFSSPTWPPCTHSIDISSKIKTDLCLKGVERGGFWLNCPGAMPQK